MSAIEHRFTAEGDEGPDATTDDLLRLADETPAEQDGPADFLAEMAAEYDRIVETTFELKLPVPYWSGRLVATFRVPDDGASERLLKAVRASAGDRSVKQRVAVCAQVAEACVALHYKGTLLDANVGFGPNAARAVKAPSGASMADVVWLAVREDLQVLGTWALRLQKWMQDPSQGDAEAVDDPFADE